MKLSFRVAIMVIVAAALLGFLVLRIWNKHVSMEVNLRPAPEFILQDYLGREVKLSDFRGKPLLVNAWAAWCPFCVDELPDFAAIQEEFKDRIIVVAINRAEPLKTAKFFSDKVGVTGRLILLLDPSDSFYQSLGGFSMPETIFVDKEGKIVFHKRGPMSLEEMRRRVQDLF